MLKILRRSTYQRLQRKAAIADRPASEDYRVELYQRIIDLLDVEWAQHQPYNSDRPGHGVFGQSWWCKVCRGPWPCAMARLVLKAHGDDRPYTVLRLEIDGERREENAVRYNDGRSVVSVRGVRPEPPAI